jgi:hypothetical protein
VVKMCSIELKSLLMSSFAQGRLRYIGVVNMGCVVMRRVPSETLLASSVAILAMNPTSRGTYRGKLLGLLRVEDSSFCPCGCNNNIEGRTSPHRPFLMERPSHRFQTKVGASRDHAGSPLNGSWEGSTKLQRAL